MPTAFQSSFIPKDQVTEEVFKKKKAGVMGVISVALFVSAVIAAGGLYFYKGILRNHIEGLQSQLAASESSIDKQTIDELSRFAQKLRMAQSLVTKHRVASNFLDLLSSSTVSAIQFSDMDYGELKSGSLDVVLTGKAPNYSSIALQEIELGKSPYVKSMSFSDLTLAQGGNVSFKMAVSLDPKLADYSVKSPQP